MTHLENGPLSPCDSFGEGKCSLILVVCVRYTTTVGWLFLHIAIRSFILAALISARLMTRCGATDSLSTEMARAQKEIEVV